MPSHAWFTESSHPTLIRTGRRGPALHVLAAVALATPLGVALVFWPSMILALLGIVTLTALMAARLEAGFLLTGLYLVLQGPLRQLAQDSEQLSAALQYADDGCILSLALAALVRRRRVAGLPGQIRVSLLLAGAAIALGFAGVIVHYELSAPALLDAFSLLKIFLVLFAASHLRIADSRALPLLRGVTLLAVGLGVFGLVDLAAGDFFRTVLPIAGPAAYRSGYRCLVSVFPHEGLSGWYFAAMSCIPLASYLIIRRRIDLFYSLFLLMVSFLSYRRKPVVGILFALVLGIVILQSGRQRVRLMAALLIALLIFVPLLSAPARALIRQAYDIYIAPRDHMMVARNALYLTSATIAVERFPLGAGLGQFGGYVSSRYYSGTYYEYGLDRVWGLSPATGNFVNDTFYPHLLGSLGLPGALLYLAAMLLPLWRPWRAMRRSLPRGSVVVITATLLVTFEALAESLAAGLYEVSLPAFTIFTLVAWASRLAASPGLPASEAPGEGSVAAAPAR